MKLSLKNLAVLMLVSFATFSCKKDKEDPKTEPTKKELLANKWRITDVKFGGTSVLALATELRCITDNIMTFKSDSTFTLEEGTNVCSPAFEGSGRWILVENDTKIKLNFSAPEDDEVLIPIEELTSSTLRVKYNLPDAPIPGDYELVLQKQ